MNYTGHSLGTCNQCCRRHSSCSCGGDSHEEGGYLQTQCRTPGDRAGSHFESTGPYRNQPWSSPMTQEHLCLGCCGMHNVSVCFLCCLFVLFLLCFSSHLEDKKGGSTLPYMARGMGIDPGRQPRVGVCWGYLRTGRWIRRAGSGPREAGEASVYRP